MGKELNFCDTGDWEPTAAAFPGAGEAAFCASIAHEISQPLAAIVANASACRRWLAASPPNHRRAEVLVEQIVEDAVSASEIISGLRVLFAQRDAVRAPAHINEVIQEACAFVVHEAEARPVEIALQLGSALPVLALDRIQIRQLLVNLLHNGIEAMEETQGRFRLDVFARRHQGGILVEVCDRGSGVVDATRIFDTFFTTKEKGMGIGLAICRQIVETHGGHLWAEPGRPQGTRMIFTLPKPNAGLRTAGGTP